MVLRFEDEVQQSMPRLRQILSCSWPLFPSSESTAYGLQYAFIRKGNVCKGRFATSPEPSNQKEVVFSAGADRCKREIAETAGQWVKTFRSKTIYNDNGDESCQVYIASRNISNLEWIYI